MTREQILQGVRQVFSDYLDIHEGIEPESRFAEDLQLDSLNLLTLVVELENHFEVCFEEGDEQGIATVGGVIDLVAGYLEAQQGQADG